MAFLAVISASQHLHAAKTNLITPETSSEALARRLQLAWRSVQFGFTHRLRDGKNHIHFMTFLCAKRPCLTAFCDTTALPSAVFGPVEFCALRRLAWICDSVDISSSDWLMNIDNWLMTVGCCWLMVCLKPWTMNYERWTINSVCCSLYTIQRTILFVKWNFTKA